MKRMGIVIGLACATCASAQLFPGLPDVLTTTGGEPVESAATWRQKRRPELLELFRTHVYGRTPLTSGERTHHVFDEDSQALDGKAIRRQVEITIRAAGHDEPLRMHLLIYLPTSTGHTPAPVMLLLNFAGNHTVHPDPAIALPPDIDEQSAVPRGAKKSRYPLEEILARGYGVATVYCGDIDRDHHDGFRDGVHALFDPAEGRTPESWGTVAAWAWGLSRAMDYLVTDPGVNAERVAVLGHSRLGKTALWAGAQDERFALVISNNSGCTGAALARRKHGESVQAINDRFPHWFCENYRRYNDREEALPVDQHMLLALVAPRPVYVASATEDQWADPEGEFLSAVLAGPVYRRFGLDDLGTDTLPEPDRPLMDGHIGYHLRTGRHDLTPYDWACYLDFADRHGGRPVNPSASLARPSPAQYTYHEQERIMFVCLDPCTWQGREYDDRSTDLQDMKLPKLDVDQWCEAALAWGAKQILLVAKHTGGFCWWQTETTDYSVKNIAWRDGRGDLVDEVARACRRHGLNLGIYIYPGDDQWGAGIGSGGRTSDPARQEEYNQVLRTQWTEVLSRHHQGLIELWFDGNCLVPLADVFETYVGDRAVYFQGPHANIRWVGNEAGTAPYPGWNTLSRADLDTGVATALQGDPDGDAWAPLECDTTLYDHHWFWSEMKETKRKSLDHLVRLYYQSVGRGATFLLNSTPTTDGLIPEGDMALYRAFGKELDRRFSHPLATTRGTGPLHTLRFDRPTRINQFMLMEDYRQGHRIREFVVEAQRPDGSWTELNRGSAVGRKRIVMFEPVDASRVSLRITRHVGAPLIREWSVYYVEGDQEALYEPPPSRLAVSQGASATASDEHSAPYVAGKICDGDPGTWWGVGPGLSSPYESWVALDLGKEQAIGGTAIREPWDRTEAFRLEYRTDPEQPWQVAFEDDRMGADYARSFPPVTARYWRLHLLRSNHDPALAEWQLFPATEESGVWLPCGRVEAEAGKGEITRVLIDLSPHIPRPGQYLLRFDAFGNGTPTVRDLRIRYDGHDVHEHVLTPVKKGEMYRINRHAQVVEESRIELEIELHHAPGTTGGMEIAILRTL